ncbi:MAG: hypothetical protein K6G03_11765 [Lachnospiraceae bacterium]|nr:hypothetical protein [Lachnospiraceae bacterium]
MACFTVPAAEAIVTKVAEKALKDGKDTNIFVKRLPWLTKMLAGGSVLLAFEHVWHGEVQPFFPFLTAMSNSADTAEMLQEMGTVGVGMAAVVSVCWAGMVVISEMISKRNENGEIAGDNGEA